MKFSIKVVFILSIIINCFNIEIFPQTQRNPVLEYSAATWNQWQPCGDIVIEEVLSTLPNSIILAYHGPANGGDPFSYFPGNSIIDALGFSAYPTGTIDRVSGIQYRESWVSWMSSRNLEPAEVLIDIDAVFEPTTREFSATIDFTALTDLSGQFKFNVILTEDGIIWSQTGNALCPGDPNYVHNHLVRDMMNGALGEEIINGNWNLNQTVTRSISHTIPVPAGSIPDMVWDSCNVVVLVYKAGIPLVSSAEIQQAVKYPLPYINVPYLGIISPNGGESWAGGSSQTISWIGNQVNDVKIEYSIDGGISWITIIDSIPNNEFYQWNIPYTVSNDCKIKISDATNTSVSDESDNSFTIYLVEILVDEGWNMISVPLQSASMAVFDLFSNAISPAYGYNGGYYTADSLQNGFGYWLKFDSTEVIFNGGNQVDSTIIAVNNGWNIIGPFHENVNLGSIITVPDNLFISPFYGYLNGYYSTTELNIGEGYWVKTWSDGLVIMNSGNLSKEEEIEKTLFINEEWGKILVTDASGKRFTLYAVDGEIDLKRYELPPPPPSGIFDIRFGSGRMVEDLGLGIQTIEMQGITYPIKVKTEGMTIALQDETGKIISAVLSSGKELTINNSSVKKLIILSSKINETIPLIFSLEQNYPNPFNPSTKIKYIIPERSTVTIKVYDVLGNEVATLVNEEKLAGSYEVEFDGNSLTSGIYFYRIQAGNFVETMKMILLK